MPGVTIASHNDQWSKCKHHDAKGLKFYWCLDSPALFNERNFVTRHSTPCYGPINDFAECIVSIAIHVGPIWVVKEFCYNGITFAWSITFVRSDVNGRKGFDVIYVHVHRWRLSHIKSHGSRSAVENGTFGFPRDKVEGEDYGTWYSKSNVVNESANIFQSTLLRKVFVRRVCIPFR